MAESPKVPTNKQYALVETDPNPQLKGVWRWGEAEGTEGAETYGQEVSVRYH